MCLEQFMGMGFLIEDNSFPRDSNIKLKHGAIRSTKRNLLTKTQFFTVWSVKYVSLS